MKSADESTMSEFHDLVMHASLGDRRAIGAIAIAFGPSLLLEAQDALEEFRGEADGVFQEFLNVLIERRSPFDAQRDGCPLRWMDRLVRSIAQQQRRLRTRGRTIRDESVNA